MSKFIIPKLIDTDKRGKFISLVNDEFSNASIIESNKNTVRSNHYHLKDSHYIYIIFGEMDYYFRGLRGKKITKKIVKEGGLIFTPPLEIHTTVFTKKSTILVMSKYKRSKKFYENDTIRFKLI
jgi:oxalate decarboxylase/phosphoglucose isomerase-like protein (cupin superfamily)